MSSHQKPNSDISSSSSSQAVSTTRPKQRHIKLNPVSAPGLKPVTPPSTLSHLEYTPPTKHEQPKTNVNKQEFKQFQALGKTSKSHYTQSSVQNRRKGEKAGELTLLSHTDSRVSSSPPSIFPSPVPPPPTSPLSPPTEATQFASRRRKTKQSSRFDLFSPEKQLGDEVESLYTDSGSFGGVSRPIRENHIQLPHSRDSRSPSPMSRRIQMTGNTLSSINSATRVSTDAIFGSGSERRRRSTSRGSSVSPSSSQSKGATTATTSLTTSSNVCNKSTEKIDISYSPVCPLSPRKRQGPANDNTSSREPFQENYRFFLKGGPAEEKEDDDNNNERVSRIFSPAPVRDIFSPMPTTSSYDTSCKDLLDSCVELKLSRGGLKEGKRGSNSGVVFPAIRVENVDDKTNRSSEPDVCSIGEENVADNNGAVISGRRSKSVTSSSTSSPSTSPSPTSTSPTEFLRYKPTRTKSTNTLLSAEASSVIDSWLSPTLSPTPPPSSTQTRHHPENARLNWRKCGSSSTSCLLSVPTPLVKRQTAEGRVIVGVLDALAVPGAGRKGMMSRGWSRSESNLFVRTGRPVGGAGEGGMRTDEDFEGDLGEEDGRKGSVRTRKSSRQLYPGTAADSAERDANKHVKTIPHSTQRLLEHQNQDLRKPLSPPTFVTPDKADVDFPSLTPRPVSGPRPPYRDSQSGGQ